MFDKNKNIRKEDKMKRTAIILIINAIAIIIFGIILQYVDSKCKIIDKNTDFWVRNCDYK